MRIGIDPGHGGKDPGAVGMDGDKVIAKEKDIVLSIAKMVRDLAFRRDHYIFMTRGTNIFRSLKYRYTYFNDRPVSVAISIHANASPNKEARGCWIIYKGGDGKGISLASHIAAAMKKQCPALCDMTNDDGIPFYHRPPKVIDAIKASGKRLSMVYGPKAKGVCLIETAFISNKDDRDLLLKTSVQKGIAKAIMYGAEAWAKENGIK